MASPSLQNVRNLCRRSRHDTKAKIPLHNHNWLLRYGVRIKGFVAEVPPRSLAVFRVHWDLAIAGHCPLTSSALVTDPFV